MIMVMNYRLSFLWFSDKIMVLGVVNLDELLLRLASDTYNSNILFKI